MKKIIVEFRHYPLMPELKEHQDKYYEGDEWKGWIAAIPDMPGIAESGKTKLDAFNELMITLKVKIAYDNNIKL